MKESKQERLNRQLKQFNKLKAEMRKSVREMWARKINIDTRNLDYNDVVVS